MSAAYTAPHSWFQKLPNAGTPAEFKQLRDLLIESGYNEPNICERTGDKNLFHYSTPPDEPRPLENRLDALIALFYDCRFVEEEALKRLLPEGTVPLLHSLGLLAQDPGRPDMVYTTVAILPAFGVYTACDRTSAPDGANVELPVDVVYPGILDTTRAFLMNLPNTPCDAMLDIGTGTGIAALLQARSAKQVWATDITSRACRFAEFNGRLAGLTNFTVVESDLYKALEGLSFDRISIHPPYVPTKKSTFVFRDAGEDGEQIIRGAIEGLPQALRPGGRFYSVQLATDRDDGTFEQRIRRWLGPGESEYDVMLAVHSIRTPYEFLADSEVRTKMKWESSQDWIDLFNNIKARFMVYGAVLIERHEQPREAITYRALTGPGYTARDLEELLEWQKLMRRADRTEPLMNCRPLAAPDAELHSLSRLQDGSFQPFEFTLKIQQPFRTSFKCEPWMLEIVTACDGVKTWRDQYASARQRGLITAGISEAEFAGLLGLLVSIGVLKFPR